MKCYRVVGGCAQRVISRDFEIEWFILIYSMCGSIRRDLRDEHENSIRQLPAFREKLPEGETTSELSTEPRSVVEDSRSFPIIPKGESQ